MNAEEDPPQGPQSHSGGSLEDQSPESPKQTKARTGPVFLHLPRCASCYNHKARIRRDMDGESSSSAEDSGPDVDSESEAESSSSSSSSCSTKDPSEILEPPEPEETAEPESEVRDGDVQEPTGETLESQEEKSERKFGARRAPLVKSYSLPSSFPPHLVPFSLLPRPPTIISSLHLQVLSKKQDENPLYVMKQRLHAPATTDDIYGEGRRIRNPPYPQVSLMHQNRLTWSQRSLPSLQQPRLPLPQYPQQQPTLKLSYPHQQQQPQPFDPLSAQGQMLPPPPLTLPMLMPQPLHSAPQTTNTPHSHVHALFPQSCWHCSHMQFPYT